ncbi:RusA family crossover junction endodeoxyribonuclease [Beduinella massiliensis]|uniref:RusA family crossover junction endodeoxyribonuclease n=1 Tax=Beduinella massiliensis TaxID=1852363 RepID=UPI000C84F6B4
MTQKIIVPGRPCGKGRPRFDTRSGHAYTPDATRKAEESVKSLAGHIKPVERYARIKVTAWHGIPSGTSNAVRMQMISGDIRPAVKPDADNILKLVLDALNGIAYADDRQIVEASIEKWYALTPRVEIEITEVTP